MFSKSLRNSLIALVAFAAVLAAAYQLDRAAFFLRQEASRTFNFVPVAWATTLLNFVLLAGAVLLIWWLAHVEHNWLVGLAYLLLGTLAALYVPMFFTLRLGDLGVPTFNLTLYGGLLSYWTVAGSLLAIAGLFHLLRRRPQTEI
jgi:hypothetical protein